MRDESPSSVKCSTPMPSEKKYGNYGNESDCQFHGS